MDGRPKATYDPFLAPTMPPIPPIGGTAPPSGDGSSGVDPKTYPVSMMGRDSSLPSINSLMRVPTTSAPPPISGYNPHLPGQPQLGMYQPYAGASAIPGYQGLAVPIPPPSGVSAPITASPLQPAASDSPQIYDLDKNFHLNAPLPQYPPGGVVAGAEIPPPGYGGHYQQRPPMYGNYHPTSSYNYTDDYYLASTYNNYTDYANPMGYQAVPTGAPGAADPTHGSVLQPLGQQVTQLQPVPSQQPPAGSMVTTLVSGNGPQSHPPVDDLGDGGGKKAGGSSSSSGGSSGEKKAEKKPTMSSMARYMCSHCDGKEFISLPVISKHIRQHNLQLCNLCVRTFETTDELKSHECRPKGSNVSYPKCPICLKYLSNSWSLSRHMKTHNREQGGGGGSKDLSSSSDIKSSESEESSNAKMDLEGSAMDCDELSKDMGMMSRSESGAGDDMELELDGHDLMLKSSPRVMVEKLSFPPFNHTNNNNISKSEDHRSMDSSSCSDGGKTDDEGLVDEKTKKEQSDVSLEKCVVCGKEFKNRTYLYKHLKSVHTAKVLKTPSEPNSPPGSPMLKGCLDEQLDNGNAPVKSSVARALASKLSKKQAQLNGKADDDPLSTDSNNNGSNGADYLVPLTSSNANQININTSGNSITIISNVTYCNTAHEVPITTSTSGPNVGTPVTTASEAMPSSVSLTGGGVGASGLMTTTVAGSNGTTATGGGAVFGEGRRLSGETTNGKMMLLKQEGVKEEAQTFKVEPTSDPGLILDGVGVKQEPLDHSLQTEDVLDKMDNRLLEPPPFIIQKVKQDVVVVTGSEATIVQPNLINSDAMLGKIQSSYDPSQPPVAHIKDEPQDSYASGNKPEPVGDHYAFSVDAMESHFAGIGGPQQQAQTSQMQHQPGNGQQMHQSAFEAQQQQQQQQPMQQSHQMQSNQGQLDQNHTSQQQQQQQQTSNNSNSNFYGGPPPHHLSEQPQSMQNMQPRLPQSMQLQPQYMNPPHQQQQMQPSHPHMQGYDPLKMYPEHQQQQQQHPLHMVPSSSSSGLESGVGVASYSNPPAVTPNHPYHSQSGDIQGLQLAHQQPHALPVSQLDQIPPSAHLENNPPSQQTSIDNSADFDGETGGDGEQESFQSGGDGGTDGDGEVKTQICDECGKSFAKRSQLTRHKNIHKNIIYICPFCQREPFKARNSLKNHLKTNHKDMKDKWEDPAYISAQVIKEPEKVEEYMRNWNEKTKPGLNAKGGGVKEEKHPVDMLESMSNSMQMGAGVPEPPPATPKGKKKKGAKAKGAAAAAAADIPVEVDPKGMSTQNGPPGKIDAVGAAPEYYNGVPGGGGGAAPMHHQHYGGHNPYPNAYQPPYMGLGQQVPPGSMGEYGLLPPTGMDHHHLQQQQPQQPHPPPPHHHQLGGPQGGLYQAPGGYQGQHMMAPGGSVQSAYGQPYPQPPPGGHVLQQQQPPQHGHGPGPLPPSAAGPGGSASGQYGGHHGKTSNSVPVSPLRSNLQSPMSPPVSPHPQQFYQHQLPPSHHYYGGGSGPQQPGLNPYRSTGGLASRQSPAPFSPHVQQPQRTQSTDSASSALSASTGAVTSGASALVTNQYGASASGQGPYHPHHHPLQQQPPPPQQYQPPQQYGAPQGGAQAPTPTTPGIYGGAGGQTAPGPPGSNSSSGVGPVPPTPPPSASSFSSNASTSSTSSTSSAYGQQNSTPSLHHPQQPQGHHHTGMAAYHAAAYDGQQPPPSKRPRYYPPGAGGSAAAGGHPTPPPPPIQQNHHQVQQQQYYGAHHHSHHHPHHQMYNGMQPPPPSASSQGAPSAASAGGQNMGAPGYQ